MLNKHWKKIYAKVQFIAWHTEKVATITLTHYNIWISFIQTQVTRREDVQSWIAQRDIWIIFADSPIAAPTFNVWTSIYGSHQKETIKTPNVAYVFSLNIESAEYTWHRSKYWYREHKHAAENQLIVFIITIELVCRMIIWSNVYLFVFRESHNTHNTIPIYFWLFLNTIFVRTLYPRCVRPTIVTCA